MLRNKILATLLLTSFAYAETPLATPPTKSYIRIDPKARATDYMQAFELLKKEKPVGQISFELEKGERINNVIDVTLMNQGTLFFFKYNTPQGVRQKIVEVESVRAISSS